MIRDVMKESARVLVPGGIMAINVGDIHNFKGPKGNNEQVQTQLMGHQYQRFLRQHQIFLTEMIIWEKNTPWGKHQVHLKEDTVHTSYRMLITWDPIYIFRKKGQRDLPSEKVILNSRLTREQWMNWIPSVWKIDPVKNMDGHPCVYPDELVRRLILMFSYVGDTVLDPFLGSGTTVKVARELDREAIGYEKETQYKEVIMRKLGIGAEASKPSMSQMLKHITSLGTPGNSSSQDAPVAPTLCEPAPGPMVKALTMSGENGVAE